eukprot:4903813-Amphidinium_carterae.1
MWIPSRFLWRFSTWASIQPISSLTHAIVCSLRICRISLRLAPVSVALRSRLFGSRMNLPRGSRPAQKVPITIPQDHSVRVPRGSEIKKR